MFALVSATRPGAAEPWRAFISVESGRLAVAAPGITLGIHYEELVTAGIADLPYLANPRRHGLAKSDI
jgi:hypothetical protein